MCYRGRVKHPIAISEAETDDPKMKYPVIGHGDRWLELKEKEKLIGSVYVDPNSHYTFIERGSFKFSHLQEELSEAFSVLTGESIDITQENIRARLSVWLWNAELPPSDSDRLLEGRMNDTKLYAKFLQAMRHTSGIEKIRCDLRSESPDGGTHAISSGNATEDAIIEIGIPIHENCNQETLQFLLEHNADLPTEIVYIDISESVQSIMRAIRKHSISKTNL